MHYKLRHILCFGVASLEPSPAVAQYVIKSSSLESNVHKCKVNFNPCEARIASGEDRAPVIGKSPLYALLERSHHLDRSDFFLGP